MNLDRIFIKMVVLCLPMVFFTGACKKKRAFKEENGQTAEDVRRVQGENDEAMRDVNVSIMEQSLLRGKGTSEEAAGSAKTELCGVDLDTTSISQGIARLNYNGLSCNGIKKTGRITVSIVGYPLRKWKQPRCTLKIEFLAYKVTGLDGKKVQFDGTTYLANESGNTFYEMRYLNAVNLVQTQTADHLTISYDEDFTAIFNMNRRLTFNYSATGKITTCKIEGMGQVNEQTSLDNWGENRDGAAFTTAMIAPIALKSTCGSRSPVGGEQSVKVDGKEYKMMCRFAVDADGNDVSGADGCPFGWKVSWSYKKKTNTRVFPYN